MDKKALKQVKKDADTISAYAMSESLWYLSRTLPENHAIMVCLGEGLMPKAGEASKMGANPLLGFGQNMTTRGMGNHKMRSALRITRDTTMTRHGWPGFGMNGACS